MPKEFYTVAEVAEKLGKSRQWVSKLAKQGRIKAQKFGRDYMIPEGAWEHIELKKRGPKPQR
jgi:excisionase family DNA binding protein